MAPKISHEEATRRRQKGSLGFWASPEMIKLADKPGYLSGPAGGDRLRVLYCDESGNQELSLASDFVKACYIGDIGAIHQAVDSGTGPDLEGYETDLRLPYLCCVVLGAQRLEVANGASYKPQHAEVLKYLIEMGCPIDRGDIAGYSPLFHSVMNFPRLDLARILLDAGASPSHQNKFGSNALMECLQQNHWKSMDLLLEHGADLDQKDADGMSARLLYVSAGPQVTAVVQKWIRTRNGEEAVFSDSKACNSCGKKDKSLKLSFCAVCRLTKYCSKECQRKDWPSHKPICRKLDEASTITLRPLYTVKVDNLRSLSDHLRSGPNFGPGTCEPELNRPITQPAQKKNASDMIIKVQLPMAADRSAAAGNKMLVYNRKRNFLCHLDVQSGRAAYQELFCVVRERGVEMEPGRGGVKAYFQADLKNKNELVIRIGEVLAPQPF